jgi:hypothetical protein
VFLVWLELLHQVNDIDSLEPLNRIRLCANEKWYGLSTPIRLKVTWYGNLYNTEIPLCSCARVLFVEQQGKVVWLSILHGELIFLF